MYKYIVPVLTFIIIAVLVLVGLLFALSSIVPETIGPVPTSVAAPTLQLTALAQFTPTPGYSNAQNATAVALAAPTPYVEWTPAKAQVFIEAMSPKAYTETKNLLISSELGSPGGGWVCIQPQTDIFGFYKIKGDVYCRISLTWTDWQILVNPEDFEVKVEEGTHVQVLKTDANGNQYYEERALAKVTITVKQLGINSPGTRFDQRFDFYKETSGGWSLIMDLKSILTGQDQQQKANEMTSDAPDLALADSFAPLQANGSRSATFTDQLYQAFVESLTTPGEQHVYTSLLETARLTAGFQCPANEPGCVNHNFAGLESLTVIVPAKPNSPCDYVYADDMVTKVLPAQYCTYTMTATGIDRQTKDLHLAKMLDPNLPTGHYKNLVDKFYSIP